MSVLISFYNHSGKFYNNVLLGEPLYMTYDDNSVYIWVDSRFPDALLDENGEISESQDVFEKAFSHYTNQTAKYTIISSLTGDR